MNTFTEYQFMQMTHHGSFLLKVTEYPPCPGFYRWRVMVATRVGWKQVEAPRRFMPQGQALEEGRRAMDWYAEFGTEA